MFKQGFIILFRSPGDQALQACPVLASDPTAAGELFIIEREMGAEKEGRKADPCEVVAVLSATDLERHRRSILDLARTTGTDLVFGPARAG